VEQRTRVVAAVLKAIKLPPRFQLRLVKEDPVRLELILTPAYGKEPILVGLVESQELVARRDREGRIPRDLQGTWDWTVRHGKVSTGGWNPYLKEALRRCLRPGFRRSSTRKPPVRPITRWMVPATCAESGRSPRRHEQFPAD